MVVDTLIETQKRRILIVDDDDVSRGLVGKALEYEGYQVRLADSGAQGIEMMNTWQPHLVLLDVNMPGLNGLQTLTQLRVRDEYVSVLFVSGNSKVDDVIRGLDAGADDYICKPFDVGELLSRVRAQLRTKDLNDSLKRANAKLKELIDLDDLTGLYNMRSLYKKLDSELDRARRHDRSLCVMMMDLDHFKKVNDSHDHLFGSYVLQCVGAIIRESIRKVDFAARYGGDEYLLVLTEINQDGAVTFANRLRARIESSTFANEFYSMNLTVSIGLAICNPNATTVDARSLVRFADRALYNAKEQGRNRVEVYKF